MNCEILDNLLLDLLYDELDGNEKIEAQAHLEGCEGCQQKFAAMGGVRRAFQAMPEPELPAFGHQALLAEAEAAAKRHSVVQAPPKKNQERDGLWAKLSAGMRLLLSPPVAVAAGVILVLGVSLSIGEQSSSPSPAKTTLADEPLMVLQGAAPLPAAAPPPPPAFEAGVSLEALNAPRAERPAPTESKAPLMPISPPAESKPKSVSGGKGYAEPVPTTPVDAKPQDAGVGGSLNFSADMTLTPQKKADSAEYQQSISNGNNAYRLGDLEEAEKQYQNAADKALDGSKDQDIALAAQAQTQSAGRDCGGALESARKISSTSKGTALLAAADCYNAAGDFTRAKELYSEVSSLGGAAGTEAKRSLLALETKLSKPLLEETKTNKSPKAPAKNTNKKIIAEPLK